MLISRAVGFIELGQQRVGLFLLGQDSVYVRLYVADATALDDFVSPFSNDSGIQHGGQGKHRPRCLAIGKCSPGSRGASGCAGRSRGEASDPLWGPLLESGLLGTYDVALGCRSDVVEGVAGDQREA